MLHIKIFFKDNQTQKIEAVFASFFCFRKLEVLSEISVYD